MAAQPADKWEERRDQMNDAQLRSLKEIANTAPEKALEEAFRIGVITKETRDKIKTAMDDLHIGLFKRAIAEEKKLAAGRNDKNTAVAFIRAFEHVYGKFMLEQGPEMVDGPDGKKVVAEGELEHKDSELMKMMEKVLKFKVDAKHCLKGRSELQAVVRRLREYIKNRKPELIETKNKVPKSGQRYLEDKSGVSKFDYSIDELENQLNLIERRISVDKVSPKELIDFFSRDPNKVLSLSEGQLDSLYKKIQSDQYFARKLLGIELSAVLDKSGVTSGRRALQKIFHPDKFADAARYSDDDRVKMNTMSILINQAAEILTKAIGSGHVAPLDDPFAKRDSILNRLTAKKAALKANLDKKTIKEVLEKAFGLQLSPEKMKEIERVSSEAGAKKMALEEGYKLVTGDAPKDVHAKFTALKKATVKDVSGKDVAVPLTAESLRKAEALDAKMKEHKEEFGRIKELFSDSKTAALNDAFLKLGEFRLAYDEAVKPEFNDDLNKQSSELAAYKAKFEKEPVRKFAADKKTKAETEVFKLGPKVKRLEDVKAKSLQYKEKAEAFIKELREYLIKCKKAFELGLPGVNSRMGVDFTIDGPFNFSSVVENIEKLGEINVSTGANIPNLQAVYDFLKPHFAEILEYATQRQKDTEFGVKEGKDAKDKKADLEKAKTLHADLKPLVEKVKKAVDLGVDIKFKDPTKTIMDLKSDFDAIKPEDEFFDAAELVKFYEDYFEDLLKNDDSREELASKFEKGMSALEEKVKNADKELKLAKEASEKCKDLTDAQAARKIIGVFVAEEFPTLPIIEQEKIAKLLLAGDVEKLMTEESYQELAMKGSADLLDTVKQVGLRGRLIGFKYKEGDKTVHPFEGLKPESFKDWPSIKNLFDIKKLNYKNGCLLLAALEIFDEEKKEKVISIQLKGTQQKVKELLAEQLGVKDRMDEAGVRKIVDDAFKAQMEKVRPLIRTHFENYNKEWDKKDGKGLKSYRIEALNLEHKDLQYKLRTGEIDMVIYDLKVKALLKKAEEADVLEDINFGQNTVMSKFWHNKYSQWIRDKGINWSKFGGAKVARGSWGATKGVGMAGLHGIGKLGLRGSSLGVGALKYPTALLTGIGSGILSIFRRGKWWDNVKKDVGKVMSTAGGWQDKMVATSKKLHVFGHVIHRAKAEAAKPKMDTKKHEERERVKKKKVIRTEKIKLLNEKAEIKPLEVTESPFIDLAEFKSRISALDKMLGTSTTFPEDKAKAGTEHKADKKNNEPAKEAAHEKKDDHEHPPTAEVRH